MTSRNSPFNPLLDSFSLICNKVKTHRLVDHTMCSTCCYQFPWNFLKSLSSACEALILPLLESHVLSASLPSTHSMGHVGGVLPNVTTKIALDFKKYSFITLWPKIWTFSLQFVSDSACKTEQLCNLNSDSIYVMNCIPCVVHLTIGLDLQLCFISSKRKWVCGPCPLTPLLSIPSDPTCLP